MKNYDAIIAGLQRQINALKNIKGGAGITVTQSPGGMVISSRAGKAEPAKGTATASTLGGITLELYPLWDGDRKYRLNERIVYKGGGETYYQIYECADITAASGDVPGVSAKWTNLTEIPTLGEWSAETTYDAAAVVMWGSPWQFRLYTSIAGSNTGNLPSDATKWTLGADVTLGIVQWPPAAGVWVPFKEHILSDTRYDIGTYQFELLYNAHTFDKGGNLRAVSPGDYTVWAEAEACVPA